MGTNSYRGGYYFGGAYFSGRAPIATPTATTFSRIGPDPSEASVISLSSLPLSTRFAVSQSLADPAAAKVVTQ
jgi:hypothetical protein